jgi:nucleoside-diphosphate-sugar epimerase
MSKIALFGATGAIGQSIAAALRLAGQPYRVVGRSRTALQTQFGSDPLAEIVYTVGVPYKDFHLHPILMRKTLAGAIAPKDDRND